MNLYKCEIQISSGGEKYPREEQLYWIRVEKAESQRHHKLEEEESPKMSDERVKPVPKTTGDTAEEITDRRMKWPAFNLMDKDFKEYIQTSTGGFKEELIEMLRETNKIKLKNLSIIRQVLVDLKTQIREAESIGESRLRKLKNKQVWEMVDEATNTLNECKKVCVCVCVFIC